MTDSNQYVKWLTLENETGTKTLSQHGFIDAKRKEPIILEEYNGNKALCSNVFASDDGYKALPFVRLVGETLNEQTCCKKCLKIYNTSH